MNTPMTALALISDYDKIAHSCDTVISNIHAELSHRVDVCYEAFAMATNEAERALWRERHQQALEALRRLDPEA